MKKPLPAFAYAWMLEDGSLCYWAEPSRNKLLKEDDKPSPGAVIVRVELVRVVRKVKP